MQTCKSETGDELVAKRSAALAPRYACNVDDAALQVNDVSSQFACIHTHSNTQCSIMHRSSSHMFCSRSNLTFSSNSRFFV